MRFRREILTLASVAIAALALTSGVVPVHSAQPGKKIRHCVKNVEEPYAPPSCYDNFTAAISAATGGQITDAPVDAKAAMKDERLLARLNHTGTKKDEKKTTADIKPAAGLIIGIMYSDADFGGSTFTVTGSRPCTGPLNDIDFTVSYVGDEWNDEGESIKTFNNCFARLFEHRDFQGAFLDWGGDRSDFGILHDEVSSLQFS